MMSIPLQPIDSLRSLDTNASIEELAHAQHCAETYQEWLEISEALDNARGLETWKKMDESPVYDSGKLRSALINLRNARLSGNIPELVYLVRTTFSRNIANMGDQRLYAPTNSGTKFLIEDYITECELALRELASVPIEIASGVLNTLVQTRKAFGRTALVLSGGSTLGFLHAGLLRELVDNKLLPRLISGSSAGAIFASMISIHREEEFDKLWEMLEVPMNVFERVGEEESLLTHLERFLKGGTWIDNMYLKEMLQGLIGDITFQEAYNRTGRILNVTVSVSGSHDMPRLLNYLTAPNVLIWSAVVCSCAVPLVFAADTIFAKDPKTKELYPWTKASFIDGSVDNDMPLGRLAEMFNVNHFVACQVNPHIAPMITKAKEGDTRKSGFDSSPSGLSVAVTATKSLLFNEAEHTLSMLKQAGIMRSVASTLLNVMEQEYCGDITIVPEIHLSDMAYLFKNPTTEKVKDLSFRGRKATWPRMSIIRNHCCIELEIDQAIVALRSRLIGVDVPKVPEGRPVSQTKPSDMASRSAVTLPRVKSFGHSATNSVGTVRLSMRRTSVDNLFLDSPSPYRRPLQRPQTMSNPVSPKIQAPRSILLPNQLAKSVKSSESGGSSATASHGNAHGPNGESSDSSSGSGSGSSAGSSVSSRGSTLSNGSTKSGTTNGTTLANGSTLSSGSANTGSALSKAASSTNLRL